MRRPIKRSLVSIASGFLLALGALAPQAMAAEGLPDSTFGNQGFTVLDEPVEKNENLIDVVVLPDGKILGAGGRGGSHGFLLARFNADGSPDTGFGNEGIKVEPDLNEPGNTREIVAIERRADGKLVAAGLGRGPGGVNAFQFARYLSNGSLDPGFGSGGLTTVPLTPSGSALAMAQAPDQKLVATGDRTDGVAVVVRVTEGGEPDPDFSVVPSAGVRLVDVPGSNGEAGFAVSVLGNGTVLIGGFADNGAFLAELDANGEPVAGFGTAGIAVHDLGTDLQPSGEIFDLGVLPDGRILATGASVTGSNDEQAFVARFTPSGELDPSFASGGVFLSNPTPVDDELSSLEILPDGSVLVAGSRGEGGGVGDTWLFRLTANGQLDGSFGSGGESIASAVPGRDEAFGLALQPDGRAVTVGDALLGEDLRLLVARFTGPEQAAIPISAPRKLRCAGKVATVRGTAKADKLKGTKRADVIAGLGGADRINALAGNDIVCGGAGKDTIDLGKGRDRARGEGGPDVIKGGPGKDELLGAAGKDQLLGGPGPDLCNGGAGKDAKAAGCETRKKLP